MQDVHGGHTPSFLFFAKPAIQNPDIQTGMFLAKMESQQSMFFYLLSSYELLGYFP